MDLELSLTTGRSLFGTTWIINSQSARNIAMMLVNFGLAVHPGAVLMFASNWKLMLLFGDETVPDWNPT